MAVAGGVGRALIQSVRHDGFRTSSRVTPSLDQRGLNATVYDFGIEALNEKGAEEMVQR
jgi:hypothetical protein